MGNIFVVVNDFLPSARDGDLPGGLVKLVQGIEKRIATTDAKTAEQKEGAGDALMAIGVDSEPAKEVVEQIGAVKGITEVAVFTELSK